MQLLPQIIANLKNNSTNVCTIDGAKFVTEKILSHSFIVGNSSKSISYLHTFIMAILVAEVLFIQFLIYFAV